MTIQEQIENLRKDFDIIGLINLDEMSEDFVEAQSWLDEQCKKLYRNSYQHNERIIFTQTADIYDAENSIGLRLRTLQRSLNYIDITNCFVIVISTNPNLIAEITQLAYISDDSTALGYRQVDGSYSKQNLDNKSKFEKYRYGSPEPLKISLSKLDNRKKFLLSKSKTFCIYPWIHLHAYPTGEAWPCCHADMASGPLGNCRTNTLKEIWNSTHMQELRKDMLSETKNSYCIRCYEQEESGFFSGRQSANKHHGHHISRVDDTTKDGFYDEFHMTYWDIRFSNLCNLSCRSCGHIFSSNWHHDQKKLILKGYWDNVRGDSWPEQPPSSMDEFDQLPELIKNELINDFGGEFVQHLSAVKKMPVLHYSGKTETDMWEQLLLHIDYVEQIYFAGGEPLLMEEHYNILEELERRGKFDVRLIYNTNFTHTDLKGRSVFDYWKKFDSVAVGASLDAMGPRAEYIRKGTKWNIVEENRRRMIETCPDVDFYISPTLSIMNAWHLPDFHRDWVEKGLLNAQDLNVNILQDPAHYRIDIAPVEYKQRLRSKFEKHLEWLRPLDRLNRATVGFESAIKFMMGTDNTSLISKFKTKTQQLDQIRGESILAVLPELEILFNENSAP